MSRDYERCKGRSKQRNAPCDLPPIPFGDYCRFHGGNTKAHREKARKRMREYEVFSTEPPWMKRYRLKCWQESQHRWEMRRARKQGPEYVDALLRERAAAKAEKEAWRAENRRLRAEQRRAYRESQRPVVEPSEPVSDPYVEPERFDPYGITWDL